MALEIFGYYATFCVGISITCWFTIYKPIFKQLVDRPGVSDELIEMVGSWSYMFILLFLTSLTAPVMIGMMLNGPEEEFVEEFIENLMAED